MASSFLGRGPEIRDKSILTLPGKNNVKCTHGVHSYIPSWIPPPDVPKSNRLKSGPTSPNRRTRLRYGHKLVAISTVGEKSLFVNVITAHYREEFPVLQ
jgi:hypothetical protein